MDTSNFTYGLRIAGAPHEPRRVVGWRKVFEKHCTGELGDGEAYVSAWKYDGAMLGHVKATGGPAGFRGPVWADWIPVDIDGTGSDPVADALDRTRRLLGWLERCAAADLSAVPCWFSGSKGCHVFIPTTGLLAKPGAHFNGTARAFASIIGHESGCGPDLAIYDSLRILRAPNTRHPRSGLFKIALRAEEVVSGLNAETVRQMAAQPRPEEPPEPPTGAWCDWTLRDLWSRAADAVAQTAAAQPVENAARIDLNRKTMDAIRCGVREGERRPRLFSAGANLGEFGCPERLALALLMPMALDSGLSTNEARKPILDGLRRGGSPV